MYTKTNISSLKLFQQIGRSIRLSTGPEEMLKSAVDALGWHFNLDRCIALLMDETSHTLVTKAEFHTDGLKPAGRHEYQLLSTSELYRLLAEGRPVPLTEIQAEASQAASHAELGQLVKDTDSRSVVAFPLLKKGILLGCLTMHHCREDRSFTEELLEVGEAFAEELSGALQQASLLEQTQVDGRVFASSSLPLVVLDYVSCRIVQTNAAAAKLLDGDEHEMVGLPFLELFGQTDATRLKEAIGKLSSKNPVCNVHGLLAPSAGGQTVTIDAALSTVEDGSKQIVMALFPAASNRRSPHPASPDQPAGRVEELVSSLSRQLTWERLTRQIISKMHSSLDRDTVLQTAADSVGRALRASACLVIRTDTPTAYIVTHEYADANLSPLGLGRTGQLPSGAIQFFKQRTHAISDLSNPNRPPGIAREDANALLDSGISAVLSTPIAYHGAVYGVLIVESNDAREWTQQEIEMLETIAQQAALALLNAQSYAQVKDQLFNMNLISNLTQQLTNALDLACRNACDERPVETQPLESPATPLSSRELEVLKLIASGLANREIAQKLFLTESTVELHASRIRKKLKLKSRTALVKYACDNHLV